MSTFVPCRNCRRHVRAAEPRCLFCGADAPAAGVDGSSTGRTRTLAILSAAALTLVACKDATPSVTPEPAASTTAKPSAEPPPSPSPAAMPPQVASAAPSPSASPAPPPSVVTAAPTAVAPQPTRQMATRYGIPSNRKPTTPNDPF